MDFNENEKKIINKARKAITSFRKHIHLFFALWIAALIASLLGYFDFEKWLYPSIGFIISLRLLPGIGIGPKYVDLVNLLESKNPKKDAIDTFVDAYKEVQER